MADSYVDPDTGVVYGQADGSPYPLNVPAHDVGTVIYGTMHGSPYPLPATELPGPATDVDAMRQARYEAARTAALGVQETRARDAAQYQPPGSPSQYLSSEGKLLGPVQYDELGIPKPAPAGNVGIRGYPTSRDYAAVSAFNAARQKEDQFNADVNAAGPFGSRYPAAPKFDMPSTDQLISPLIAARRNAVQLQLNDEQSRAAGLSTAPVFSGGRYGRWGPSPASVAQRNIAGLQQEIGRLDRVQQETIETNRKYAEFNQKINEKAAVDTAAAQMHDFFPNIDPSRYPIGSQERTRLMAAVLSQRPDWWHAMSVDKALGKEINDKYIQPHEDVGQSMAALQKAYPDLKVTGYTIGTSGKPSIRFGPTKPSPTPKPTEVEKAATKVLSPLGLTGEDFAKRTNERGTSYGDTEMPRSNEQLAKVEAGRSGEAKNVAFDVNGKTYVTTAGKFEMLNSQFPKPVRQIPQAAMDALKDNPDKADEFDAKFGKGSAKIILGQ